MKDITIYGCFEGEGGQRQTVDITDIVTALTIQTSLDAQPGQLDATLVVDGYRDEGEISLGAGIRVVNGNTEVFSGFVFSVSQTRAKTVQIVAYDVLRYLKNQATYVFSKETLDQIFKKVCEQCGIEAGTVDSSSKEQPARAADVQSGFDVIEEAIGYALAFEKKYYVLQAEGTKLALRDIENLKTDILIDEENGEIDFQHTASIDQDTYNKVVVAVEVKDAKSKGKSSEKSWSKPIEKEDTQTQKSWGLLQYTHIFNDSVSYDMAERAAENLLAMTNRIYQTLQVTCQGNWEVKAGTGLHIRFSRFKSFDNGQGYYVKTCTHTVTNAQHKMVLELHVHNVVD